MDLARTAFAEKQAKIIARKVLDCFYIDSMHPRCRLFKGPPAVLEQEQTVPQQPTVIAQHGRARRAGVQHRIAAIVVPAVLAAAAAPVQAVDGCLVLLCLAAPSWSAIAQCVPPVTQVFRDLARGRPFPTCAMSGAGNSASHQWSSAPTFCPPQYTRANDMENGTYYSCDFSGAVAVNIAGTFWSRTWWSMGGASVTEFAPVAKAGMGSLNTKFDDDQALWLASLPPPQPPCPTC